MNLNESLIQENKRLRELLAMALDWLDAVGKDVYYHPRDTAEFIKNAKAALEESWHNR